MIATSLFEKIKSLIIKNSSAHNLAEKHFQDILFYHNKGRLSKRLIEEFDKNLKSIQEDKKEWVKKDQSYILPKLKNLDKKLLIYSNTDNKFYFVTLKKYTADYLELNVIEANQNPTGYDKIIIEESKSGSHLIEYYC